MISSNDNNIQHSILNKEPIEVPFHYDYTPGVTLGSIFLGKYIPGKLHTPILDFKLKSITHSNERRDDGYVYLQKRLGDNLCSFYVNKFDELQSIITKLELLGQKLIIHIDYEPLEAHFTIDCMLTKFEVQTVLNNVREG
ncbi:hypothetical protein ACEOWJ_001219 [Bacillus cereus]|uniref:hypothetical protein n=1 Tax=Bacillus TaxID=1386 RepID=UPI0005584547|nr:hypothetical protein [Bacillus sp. UNC322MFChir4.1]